jgi:UDP-N-acetylglucosamine 1-carboxyvinyltransferase
VSAIGKTVRDLRKLRGWTQKELGSRAGVAQNRICDIERGRRGDAFTLTMLSRPAKALDAELVVKFKVKYGNRRNNRPEA